MHILTILLPCGKVCVVASCFDVHLSKLEHFSFDMIYFSHLSLWCKCSCSGHKHQSDDKIKWKQTVCYLLLDCHWGSRNAVCPNVLLMTKGILTLPYPGYFWSFRHNLCRTNIIEIFKLSLGLGHSWHPCDQIHMGSGPNLVFLLELRGFKVDRGGHYDPLPDKVGLSLSK